MSTPSTFPAASRMSAEIDLCMAQVCLEQALRVLDLAHSGALNVLENLPPDVGVGDVRERAEDSLVLFGQVLRLVIERHNAALDLSRKLIALE
jgi:hypothetical protein